jgi:hypothetical protein
MVVIRTILFLSFQTLIAAGLLLAGAEEPWFASSAWWMLAVSLANLVTLGLLTRLYRSEGRRYWEIFRLERAQLGKDLLATLGVLLLSLPVAFLPNILLAGWLFENPAEAQSLLMRPLPAWAVWMSLLLFPITQALAEIPAYFSYSMPRLEIQTGRRWLALAWPALGLAVQHAAAPLIFDLRFIAWRALMFLPFAFLVGIVMRWRPRLLPYLAVIHFLLDFLAASVLLTI